MMSSTIGRKHQYEALEKQALQTEIKRLVARLAMWEENPGTNKLENMLNDSENKIM